MDLLCYVYPGWEPRIRPASSRREWMEATPERFAYRCLPLSIANAHGWEVLSPCGFEACWDGRPGTEGVEIRLDSGTEPHRAAVSLFGQATITFHIEGLFRTPPGWNLWVGGPPNHAKDGIQALGGIIETDWSPYTFTMNWRFTRADHWIRFEKDEPISFFFPVQRGVLDDTDPKIVPIDDAPELKQEFETWSRSRDAFQKWVAQANPAAPADKWQKLYYRGIRPGESPGAPDHETKLRLKPFAASAPANARASGAECPHPEAHVEPANISPRLAKRNAAEPIEREGDSGASLAERRRDWILSVMEAQRRLAPGATEIERVGPLSSEEFLERFYAQGRPALIAGQIEQWPALSLWSPDYLKRAVGGAEIQFQGGRSGNGDFELYKDSHKRQMPFDRYIDMITADPGNDAYITAYNSERNGQALAPLAGDVAPISTFLRGEPGMVWIGPIGTFTPLHFDLTNNLLAQVVGSKRVILVPPSETPKLANQRHVFSEVHDIMDDDRLARFPLATDAVTYELELRPGELLYIPIGWWHQVTALDFSVTYTFTDFLWKNDWFESFPQDS